MNDSLTSEQTTTSVGSHHNNIVFVERERDRICEAAIVIGHSVFRARDQNSRINWPHQAVSVKHLSYFVIRSAFAGWCEWKTEVKQDLEKLLVQCWFGIPNRAYRNPYVRTATTKRKVTHSNIDAYYMYIWAAGALATAEAVTGAVTTTTTTTKVEPAKRAGTATSKSASSHAKMTTIDLFAENITTEDFLFTVQNTSSGRHLTSTNETAVNTTTFVHGTGSSPTPGYPVTYILFASIIVTILMIVIVVGNLLVIIAIATEKSLKNIQNWFIASLAVADFFLGLLIMPFSLANELMGYWTFGNWWVLNYVARRVYINFTCTINLFCVFCSCVRSHVIDKMCSIVRPDYIVYTKLAFINFDTSMDRNRIPASTNITHELTRSFMIIYILKRILRFINYFVAKRYSKLQKHFNYRMNERHYCYATPIPYDRCVRWCWWLEVARVVKYE